MLDLGVLLWELLLDRKVTITPGDRGFDDDDQGDSEESAEEDEENAQETKDEREFDALFNALSREEDQLREIPGYDIPCLDIIANCINAVGYAEDKLVDLEQVRSHVYSTIVTPLKDYVGHDGRAAFRDDRRPEEWAFPERQVAPQSQAPALSSTDYTPGTSAVASTRAAAQPAVTHLPPPPLSTARPTFLATAGTVRRRPFFLSAYAARN